MQSTNILTQGKNIYIHKECFESAKSDVKIRNSIIMDIIPIVSDIYDLDIDSDGFCKIYLENIPIFLKLSYSSKNDNLFIDLRTYHKIKENGIKENGLKKNYQFDDNNSIDIVKIGSKMEDLIEPILAKIRRDTVINEQTQRVKNIYNTVNPYNRRNIDIGFQDRGDVNSAMRMTIRNLMEEDVNFILSMLSLVNDG